MSASSTDFRQGSGPAIHLAGNHVISFRNWNRVAWDRISEVEEALIHIREYVQPLRSLTFRNTAVTETVEAIKMEIEEVLPNVFQESEEDDAAPQQQTAPQPAP